MTPGPGGWLLLLFWSGLCSADQRALGGRQLHQPIVAATVAGLILGDPARGFLVGLWLQLVWATPMPVGGVILPDTGAAACAGAITAVFLPGGVGLLAAIAVALVWAAASVPWERSLRERNAAREEADLARIGRVGSRAILHGAAGPFGRGLLAAAATGAFAGFGSALIPEERLAWGGAAIEGSLMGGAAVFGAAALLARARAGTPASSFASWGGAGIACGLLGRILLEWWR